MVQDHNDSGEFLKEIGFHPVTPGEVVYRGIRDPDTQRGGDLDVFRCGEGKVIKLDPKPSQKLFNHSPDGFQWGYGGSGPAQLSLAILLDATQDSDLSVRLHQTFKTAFVAEWGAQWEITRTAVLEWIKSRQTPVEA